MRTPEGPPTLLASRPAETPGGAPRAPSLLRPLPRGALGSPPSVAALHNRGATPARSGRGGALHVAGARAPRPGGGAPAGTQLRERGGGEGEGPGGGPRARGSPAPPAPRGARGRDAGSAPSLRGPWGEDRWAARGGAAVAGPLAGGERRLEFFLCGFVVLFLMLFPTHREAWGEGRGKGPSARPGSPPPPVSPQQVPARRLPRKCPASATFSLSPERGDDGSEARAGPRRSRRRRRRGQWKFVTKMQPAGVSLTSAPRPGRTAVPFPAPPRHLAAAGTEK